MQTPPETQKNTHKTPKKYPWDTLEHPWNKLEYPLALGIQLVTVSNNKNSILANPTTSFYFETFWFNFDFDFDEL